MDAASPLKKQKLPPFDLNAADASLTRPEAPRVDIPATNPSTDGPIADVSPTEPEPLIAGMTSALPDGPAQSSPNPSPPENTPRPLMILRSGIPPGLSPRAQRAWEHYRKLGSPWRIVAPMVDQSELPFRMLCRKHGADAAYTPMLHSRLFVDSERYRKEHFTTCPEDRPLFVQFCANNPDTLVEAARYVEPYCDYIDLNLGCPQAIAKRGNYGSFLMDDLPLVRSIVSALSAASSVPVACKIRMFPSIDDTIAYARMLEEAGCQLLAVHGRTRDQKSARLTADWHVIKAVREAVSIPVLANGNIRNLSDVRACMAFTGADGVLSADTLLEDPAMFGREIDPPAEISGRVSEALDVPQPGTWHALPLMTPPDVIDVTIEYLEMVKKYPVPMRMVKGHMFKLLGGWFRVHTDLRDGLNQQQPATVDYIINMCKEMAQRNAADPLLRPLPDPRRQTPPEGKTMKKIIEAAVEKAGEAIDPPAGKGAKTASEYREQRLQLGKVAVRA